MPARVMTAMVLALVPLAGEAALSHRNERVLRSRRAREPGGDVYALMAVTYPTAFLGMGLEGWWWSRPLDRWFLVGLLAWLASKGLEYAAIYALGERWCFRVLVLPHTPLVSRGPYRRLRHPNYLAVMGELVAMAMICPAPAVGIVSVVGFGLLIRRRISVEERALGTRA